MKQDLLEIRSDAELDSLLLAGPIRSGRPAVVGYFRARRGEAIVGPHRAAPLWVAPASLPTPSCPSAILVSTTRSDKKKKTLKYIE